MLLGVSRFRPIRARCRDSYCVDAHVMSLEQWELRFWGSQWLNCSTSTDKKLWESACPAIVVGSVSCTEKRTDFQTKCLWSFASSRLSLPASSQMFPCFLKVHTLPHHFLRSFSYLLFSEAGSQRWTAGQWGRQCRASLRATSKPQQGVIWTLRGRPSVIFTWPMPPYQQTKDC